MNTYKIAWDIELDGENPLEACKGALDCINQDSQVFTVQDVATGKLYSVDLNNQTTEEVTQYDPLISRTV